MEQILSRDQAPDNNAADQDERFVNGVITQCQANKGLAARLRRADNPATEYQSWEFLASYGIDLENERRRLPFITVAAAIAKAKLEHPGSQTLGQALAACYENGRDSDPAKARLRRLLACEDLPEVCRILRPLFSLVTSKSTQPLDYTRILKQLRRFPFNGTQVKAQWAQEFYGQSVARDSEEART